MKKQIHIKDYFPAYISSRKSIIILKSKLDFNIIGHNISFDFSEISFISRSFAHEFIMFIETEKINAEIVNTNLNVSVMFKAVKETKKTGRMSFTDIPVTTFITRKELNSFFATI